MADEMISGGNKTNVQSNNYAIKTYIKNQPFVEVAMVMYKNNITEEQAIKKIA